MRYGKRAALKRRAHELVEEQGLKNISPRTSRNLKLILVGILRDTEGGETEAASFLAKVNSISQSIRLSPADLEFLIRMEGDNKNSMPQSITPVPVTEKKAKGPKKERPKKNPPQPAESVTVPNPTITILQQPPLARPINAPRPIIDNGELPSIIRDPELERKEKAAQAERTALEVYRSSTIVMRTIIIEGTFADIEKKLLPDTLTAEDKVRARPAVITRVANELYVQSRPSAIKMAIDFAEEFGLRGEDDDRLRDAVENAIENAKKEGAQNLVEPLSALVKMNKGNGGYPPEARKHNGINQGREKMREIAVRNLALARLVKAQQRRESMGRHANPQIGIT
jgi:hypothetical protein